MSEDRPARVYRLTCTTNGKSYIGMTIRTLQHRRKYHCYEANYPQYKGRRLSRAIKKYGEAAFVIELLYEAVNEQEALMVERALIAQYGTMIPRGYNSTSGGEGFAGTKQIAEVKERRRLNSIGKKRSPETCRKFSDIAKARPPMSAEHRANIGAAVRGRVMSEETRRKLSEVKKGIPKPFAMRAKLRAAKLGVPRSTASIEKGRATLLATWARKRELTWH